MSTEQNEAVVAAPVAEVTATPVPVEVVAPEGQAATEGQGEQQQTPKTFTQEELDRIVAKEKAKAKRQVERELAARMPEQPSPLANIPADQLTPEQQIEVLAERKAQEKLAQREGQRQQNSAWDTHADREDEAREKYPDYDQVTRAYGNYAATNEMVQAIITSNHGPDIMYHLATNPEESLRIARLSPVEQIREIGKIEAKLETTPATPVKKTSSAPAPITPVTARAPVPAYDTTDPRSISSMNTEQWIKAERERQRQKLQRNR